MSLVMRGGRPYTFPIVVPAAGGHWSLPANSSELLFRPRTGVARIYWTEADFRNDPDGTLPTAKCMILNGDTNFGAIPIRAAIGDIWVRGEGAEIELTVLGQQT